MKAEAKKKAEAEAKKKKERIENKIKGVSFNGVNFLFFCVNLKTSKTFERFFEPVLFMINILKASDHLRVVFLPGYVIC